MGYWRKPALTATTFLPDPFSKTLGSRMYRTGDFGRQLPDGSFEYLGRVDLQVKIRDHRVEIEEVEHALSSLPHVAECVVTADEGPSGNRYLVAYVVPETNGNPERVAEIRRALRKRLPDYMVPARLVIVDSLPRTPNDKVDRQALPRLRRQKDRLDAAAIGSHTHIQTIVTEIWADLLNIEQLPRLTISFNSGEIP